MPYLGAAFPAHSPARPCISRAPRVQPLLISHVTVPTLGLKPGAERSTVTGALCRARCARRVRVRAWCDAARISDYYHGPIYTREYL